MKTYKVQLFFKIEKLTIGTGFINVEANTIKEAKVKAILYGQPQIRNKKDDCHIICTTGTTILNDQLNKLYF